MANAPIIYPRLWSNSGMFPGMLRATQSDGSNTFVAGQFVRVNSNALVAYAADDTSVYGLTLDPSHTSTEETYSSIYGENHNVIDPRNAVFIMNITDGSGTVGSGSTTHGDVAVGTRYSATYLTSPSTALGLDASDSGTATKNIFEVVALYNTSVAPDGDASTDKNGRVLVKIIDSAIQ